MARKFRRARTNQINLTYPRVRREWEPALLREHSAADRFDRLGAPFELSPDGAVAARGLGDTTTNRFERIAAFQRLDGILPRRGPRPSNPVWSGPRLAFFEISSPP